MAGSLTFITGGARCGKSSFAEQLARAHRGPVAFVATAAVGDAEMASRVARHQSRRPVEWTTFDCQGSLAATVAAAVGGQRWRQRWGGSDGGSDGALASSRRSWRFV